jgi:hypothetical protein
MAGEAASGGGGTAAPAAQPAAAPASNGRAKISDMGRELSSFGPAVAQPGVVAEVGPQGGPARGVPPEWMQESAPGPEMGQGGDLDEAASRQNDGLGDEFGDGEQDALVLDNEPAHSMELVDPNEYTALKAKWDADDLAPEFDAKWVTQMVKNRDGSTYPVRCTVAELKAGNLRHVDYSSKLAEVKAMRDEAQATIAGGQKLMADLSQPRSLIQAMHTLGKYEVFLAACEIIAAEEVLPALEMQKQNPRAFQEFQQRKAMERRLVAVEQARIRAEQMALQAQQQQPQQAQASEQQIAHQLQQMFPTALKQVGIEQLCAASQVFKLFWNEPVGQGVTRGEQLFFLHFQNMLPSLEGPLTTQFVVGAMQAARETVEQMVRDQAPRAGRNSPPPVQGAAPRPNAAPANGQRVQNGRGKISDMQSALSGFRR